MPEMKAHPAAEAFPMLSPLEMPELVKSVREKGLVHEIITYDGMILDGRNRYAACLEAGIEPRFRKWNGECGSPVAFVIAMNLERRQLSASQRAMAAEKLLPMLEAEAKGRMSDGGKSSKRGHGKGRGKNTLPYSGKSTAIAAEAVGVSEKYVRDAKRLNKEDPDLAQEVREGKTSLPAARKKAVERKAKSSPPPPMERAVVQDKLGHVVPDRCRVAFRSTPGRVRDMLRQIRLLKKEILEIEKEPELGSWFDAKGVRAAFDNIDSAIKFIEPHGVCPYCGGKRANCKACHGFGWMPKIAFESAPLELREGLDK